MAKKQLMMGNDAVARGAWEAGVRVATAYPGTPATEINEMMATYPEVDTEWSVNEKVALEVAIGASFAGVRALCSMKHVGVNVASDPLFTLAYGGVNAGLVIVTADEPGLHSSQNEQDNRYYAKFAEVPMLEPSDAQEAKEMVKDAFEISEEYDTPVFLRLTTRICHTLSVVELGQRKEPRRRPYQKDPTKTAMVPPHAYGRHFKLEKRETLLEALSNTSEHNRTETRSLEFGVITSGISYQNVREALPDYSVLKIGMTYPIPRQLIRNFASQVKYLYVVEENRPFLEEAIQALGIAVDGKQQLLRVGELPAEQLRRRILYQGSPQKAVAEDVPKRPPQFCPGCGHRGIFYLLGKHKLTVNGDIGCYGLAALPPYDAMDTLICMGASIGMNHGMDKVREGAKHSVAVIGDSTFFHSGMTSLASLVHNGGQSITIILDNRITAMTGHQPSPTTGRSATRDEAPVLGVAEICHAFGIEHVYDVDGNDLKEIEERLLAELERPEPSVIIVNQKCVIVERKKTGQPYRVNEECRACRTCFTLGCPAITVDDGKAVILEDFCDGCSVCAQVCPARAIVQKEKST